MTRAARTMADRGVVLPVVLVLLSLVAALALAFLERSRAESLVVRNNVAAIGARNLAEGGLYLGIASLLRARAEPGSDIAMMQIEVPFETAKLRISVTDETGKIDINAAPGILLNSLLKSVGVDEDRAERVADAILDWRDADDSKHLHGAEAGDYANAEELSGPANRPFVGVEELQQVIGLDGATYRKLLPLVTVWSHSARIYLPAAPAGVLRALPGANPTEVDMFIKARTARTASGSSEPLPALGNISNWVSSAAGSVYRVVAVSEDDAVAAVEAIVRLGGATPAGYQILRIADTDAAIATGSQDPATEAASDSAAKGARNE